MTASINLAASSTTHLLHRVGQLADDLLSRSIGDLGITARQFVVLSVVDGLENPSQVKLCEVSGIDHSTIADIVCRLVGRGLLKRRRTRSDARTYAIQITAEGKIVLEKAAPIAQKVDAALLSSLTPAECEKFKALLKTIVSQSDASQVEQAKVA